MAVPDTAIREKPKHFNPGPDGRVNPWVKPGHDKGSEISPYISMASSAG
jgi:hypothetical protein